ncbi:MAG: hypothetical protein ACE5J6_01135 [Candidatus Bathyarchaeia archaeon]
MAEFTTHIICCAFPFAAFIILLCLAVSIYRQKVTSPGAKISRLNLVIFVLLLSFSMITETVHHFSESIGAEIYEAWSIKFFYSLTFIAVIFFINAISVSVEERHVGGLMERFKHGLWKPGVTLFLQAFALAMALMTFLPSAIPKEEPPLWYNSMYLVFVVLTSIVLAVYFRKALAISKYKRATFAVWGGAITLIGFQFSHFYIEHLEEAYLATASEMPIFNVVYITVSFVAAVMILIGFREKTTLEQFVLPMPTMEVAIGYADAFSTALGLDRRQMAGRKILFEFDPASNYEKAIQDFVAEALANAEPIAVFTSRGSAVHSALSGQESVRFIFLTQSVSAPRVDALTNDILLPASNTSLLLDAFDKVLKACPERNLSIVFDDLSNLVLLMGFKKVYGFVRYALEMLTSENVTCLFLFNPMAHDLEVTSSLRSLFKSQVRFRENRLQIIRLPEALLKA